MDKPKINQNYILLYIKKIGLKITVFILRGLIYLGDFLVFIGRNLKKPLLATIIFSWKSLGRPVILTIYKTGLLIKKYLRQAFDPQQNKFLSLLTNQYTIHTIIILIALFTAFTNINAQETRQENAGEKSVLFSMVKDELSEEYIIEEGPVVSEKKKTNNEKVSPLSYLDNAQAIRSQLKPMEYIIEEINEEEMELPTAQGGGALVKTNIASTHLGLKTRDSTIEYNVKPGDTVSSIAQEFGLRSSTILWANNLSSYSYIRPGDVLKILPTNGVSHKIKSGDTISKIAKKYGTEEEKIIAFNKLVDATDITVGEIIMVPGGQIVPTYTSRTTWSPSYNYKKPTSSAQKSSDKMLWPTNGHVITQYYHWRHHGLDIDGDYSSPLYAADSGTVESVGWLGGYGLQILINHGNGIKTRYAHASKIFVSRGQKVNRGETIAMMGTTGHSTGTHIHFEVIVNGIKQNPLHYIR